MLTYTNGSEHTQTLTIAGQVHQVQAGATIHVDGVPGDPVELLQPPNTKPVKGNLIEYAGGVAFAFKL